MGCSPSGLWGYESPSGKNRTNTSIRTEFVTDSERDSIKSKISRITASKISKNKLIDILESSYKPRSNQEKMKIQQGYIATIYDLKDPKIRFERTHEIDLCPPDHTTYLISQNNL